MREIALCCRLSTYDGILTAATSGDPDAKRLSSEWSGSLGAGCGEFPHIRPLPRHACVASEASNELALLSHAQE